MNNEHTGFTVSIYRTRIHRLQYNNTTVQGSQYWIVLQVILVEDTVSNSVHDSEYSTCYFMITVNKVAYLYK